MRKQTKICPSFTEELRKSNRITINNSNEKGDSI